MSTPQSNDKLLISRGGVSYSITYSDLNGDAVQALADAASAQTTADAALPKSGGTMTGDLTSTAGATFENSVTTGDDPNDGNNIGVRISSVGVVRAARGATAGVFLGYNSDNPGNGATSRIQGDGSAEFDGGVKVNSSGDFLTHYEEGTWTPSFTLGGTTASGTFEGHFTRIGRVVNASCSLQLSSLNSGSGVNSVGGLPYTVGSLYSGTTVQGGGSVTYFANGGNRERATYSFNVYQGETFGSIFGGSNSDVNHSDLDIRLTEGSFANDSSIRLVFTYFV